MRKILIPVAVLVVLAGGYTAVWYKKSADFKLALEQSVANLNAQYQDPEHKDIPVLRYSALRASGFPLALTYTFENPTFTISRNQLIKTQEMMGAAALPATGLDWRAEYASEGSVSLSTNLLFNHFVATSEGASKISTFVANTPRYAILVTTDKPQVCTIAIEHHGNVPVITDAASFLAIFRHLDCSVEGMHAKEATRNVPLADVESATLSASNAPAANGNHVVDVQIDEKNAQSTAAYDVILNDYMTIIAPQLPAANQPGKFKFNMAEYGQRNFSFFTHYDGPTEADKIFEPRNSGHIFVPGLKLHVDVKLDSSNALFTSNNTLSVNIADQIAAVTLHSTGNTSEKYDAFLHEQIANMLSDIAQAPDAPVGSAMLSDDAFITAVTPSLHKLGNTRADIDFTVKFPEDKKQQSLVITAFNLSATPYGLALKGNLDRGMLLPTGDVTLTCTSCDALVKDLGNYIAGIEKASLKYRAPGTALVVSDGLIEGIRQFLHGIAEQSNTPDVVIHLVVKNTGEMTVSGKQPNQVMVLFSTLVAPYLKPATPAEAPVYPVVPSPVPQKH